MLHLSRNMKIIRLASNMSQSDFGKVFGVTKAMIISYESGRAKPDILFLDRLKNKTGLSENQLMNQLLMETDFKKVEKEENVSRGTFHQELLNKKNGVKPQVPVFGGFTTLGNIEVFDDENLKHKVIAQLPAEVFPGCDYAEKAKGDSMYPLIMNQALLVGKTCTVKGITFGEKYIIKTKDGMDTTKFIHPGSKNGKIRLKAYNKSIPDQEISMDEIVFACRIHWIVNPT